MLSIAAPGTNAQQALQNIQLCSEEASKDLVGAVVTGTSTAAVVVVTAQCNPRVGLVARGYHSWSCVAWPPTGLSNAKARWTAFCLVDQNTYVLLARPNN
jgi:hypothetical protein